MAKVKAKKAAKTATPAPAKAQTPTPQPEATTEKVKRASPNAGINRGRTSGLRVMQYQDQLLADNVKARLTDAQLLEKLREEFPNAKGKIFTAPMEQRLAVLRSVRRLFNAGKHGSQSVAVPDGGVPEFGEDRKPMAERPRERGVKKDAKAA